MDNKFDEPTTEHIQTRKRQKRDLCEFQREKRVCNTNSIIKGEGWIQVSQSIVDEIPSGACGYYKRNGTFGGKPKYTQKIDPAIFKSQGVEQTDAVAKLQVEDYDYLELFYHSNSGNWVFGRQFETNEGIKTIFRYKAMTVEGCPLDVKKWDGKKVISGNTFNSGQIVVRCATAKCCD